MSPVGHTPDPQMMQALHRAQYPSDANYPPFDEDTFEETYFGRHARPEGCKDDLDEIRVVGGGYGSKSLLDI